MKTPRCLLVSVIALSIAPAVFGASFWDSRPLKIIQQSELEFPAVLAMQGVREGQVRAVLTVNAEGKFEDCLITGYTHPELATEVLKGVRWWDYEPARQRGEPVGTRVEVSFSFEARGSVMSLTAIDSVTGPMTRMLGTRSTVLVSRANELDHPLTTLQVVSPRHPGNAIKQPTGSVMIDFYVDPEGRPRMPVVTRLTHEAFAMAAIDALSQWRFVPPRKDGRPVSVRVVQRFDFPDPT